MPVLTGADLRAAQLEGREICRVKAATVPVLEVPIEIPDIPEEPEPVPPTDGYRMHHPDDPYYSMNCTIDVDGIEVQIKQGVALVGTEPADELERRGWRRGAKVENYADFQ